MVELTVNEMKKLQNAADITRVQMIMARYVEYISKFEALRAFEALFAKNNPDVTVEINECGGYIGPNARLFMERYDKYLKNPSDKRGWMDIQELNTPYVIISKDSTHARGQWGVFNPQSKPATEFPGNVRQLTAIWCFSKYLGKFLRIDNDWKILKLRQITYVRAPFDQGWNKQPDCYRMPAELYFEPDTPSRSSIYNPDCIYSGHGIYNWGPYLPDEDF